MYITSKIVCTHFAVRIAFCCSWAETPGQKLPSTTSVLLPGAKTNDHPCQLLQLHALVALGDLQLADHALASVSASLLVSSKVAAYTPTLIASRLSFQNRWTCAGRGNGQCVDSKGFCRSCTLDRAFDPTALSHPWIGLCHQLLASQGKVHPMRR